MSRIDELIARLCPEGVKFRVIREVLRIKNGRDHKPLGHGDIPVYGSGGIMRYVDTAAADGPSVLIPRKGSLGNIFYVEGPFWVVDTIFRTEINSSLIVPKFLYHQLLTMRLGEMNQAGGVPSQTQSALNLLRIPVPPLEVQCEIVRILDQFTQLEAELEAELEARRRQYEYYRTRLLTAGGERHTEALGDIAKFKYGLTAKAQDSGDFRFLRITDIDSWGKLLPNGAKYVSCSDDTKQYVVRQGDLLMARTGATFGKTLLVDNDEPAVYASYLIRIRPDESVLLPDYYWHFAQSSAYWSQANAMVSSGGQPQFNANSLKKVQISLPSICDQRQIVETLDSFDALVNDLSVGLPAELKARRKQYEYYRDKLLTFEELPA